MRMRVPRALLRDRVCVYAPTRLSDGQGGYESGWTVLADDVPADVHEIGGAELLRYGGLAEKVTHSVWMEAVDGLTSACQLDHPVHGRLQVVQTTVTEGGQQQVLGWKPR